MTDRTDRTDGTDGTPGALSTGVERKRQRGFIEVLFDALELRVEEVLNPRIPGRRVRVRGWECAVGRQLDFGKVIADREKLDEPGQFDGAFEGTEEDLAGVRSRKALLGDVFLRACVGGPFPRRGVGGVGLDTR